MHVYVIEIRELKPEREDTMMHIASSWENAEDYVRRSGADASLSDEWYWWVLEEEVDIVYGDIKIRVYNPDGTRRETDLSE